MPEDITKQLEAVTAAFEQAKKDLAGQVAARDAEMKALRGEMTEETKKAMDAADVRFNDIKAEYDAMKKALNELEIKTNRPGFGSPAEEAKSAGQQFVESDAYKEMVRRGSKSCDPVNIKGSVLPWERKDLSAATAGALAPSQRIAQPVLMPEREFRLMQLLGSGQASSNAIEYVEETGYANLYTLLTSQAASGQKVITVASTAGMYAGQTIYVNAVAYTIATVDSATQATMTANIATTTASGAPVMANTYAPVADGAEMPKANLVYETKTANVKTLGNWIPATDAIINDATLLASLIDRKLSYGYMLSVEEQVLYGTGTGDQLPGLLTHASRQTLSWSACPYGSQQIDVIRRAITLVSLAKYPASAVVLNPTDWQNMELLKDTTGRYLWINVNMGGEERLWRLPVVSTEAIRSGEAMVGALNLAAVFYDRQQPQVLTTNAHEDYFIKNMQVIKLTGRGALADERPQAFVHVTFDEAPAAS